MAKRYEYQPLCQSTSDIRLLRLLPSNGNHTLKNIPSCEIFHTSLQAAPGFEALSYAWGDASDKRIILLGNCSVRVTSNLFNAIMALRPLKEPSIIWIDSLCINQSDTNEKSWQVGLMSDIYQQAQKVIAWLGPADGSSDAVIDYLITLGERAHACGLSMGCKRSMEIWQTITSDPLAFQKLPESLDVSPMPFLRKMVSKYAIRDLLYSIDGWHEQDALLPMGGIKRLFGRSWWERIWVLQEVTLPTYADFMCGTKRISRSRFCTAFDALYALWEVVSFESSNRKDLTDYQLEVVCFFSHRPKLMLSAWKTHMLTGFSLAGLLRATCIGGIVIDHFGYDSYQHLLSTDPRDKIFALLGLARDRDHFEECGIFPDYGKSKDVIFTLVTAALLEQGHIWTLSCCCTPETPQDLPSWVPDWSQPLPDTLQNVESDYTTPIPKFDASGSVNSQRNITIIRQGDTIEGLSIDCYVYDKIQEIGEVPRVPESETCFVDVDWIYEILRLTYKSTDTFADFHQRLLAVVRTSCGGITVGFGAPRRIKDDLLDARCLEAQSNLQQNIHKIEQQHIRSELKQYFAVQKTTKRLRKMADKPLDLVLNYIKASAKRAPFVTEKGHLGLSSWHAKPGDIVALIHGAQVPFILRHHRNGKYRIVSEAYVDGIMDGEAAQNADWQKLEFV